MNTNHFHLTLVRGGALSAAILGLMITFTGASFADVPAPVGGIGEGTWVVGSDIPAGTYRTAGPLADNCYFARLKDTSGDFASIIVNGTPPGPTTLTIKPKDGAFLTSGCQPWVRVK